MLQKKKWYAASLTVLFLFLFSFQSVFASTGSILKSGMRGDSVSELQQELKTLKFLDVEPTGYFGDITSSAVEEFQKSYGLTPDGIAGPKTRTMLDNLTGRNVTAVKATAMKAAVSRGEDSNPSIVDYAKRFLGVDYVWGGTSPSGFDCSGFVLYVFRKFGVELNRVSRDMAAQGSKVAKSELQPGDLVFFDTNGGHNRINHVGMYIGGGRFIQSSSEQSGVVISDITGGFYANTYMTARRVLDN